MRRDIWLALSLLITIIIQTSAEPTQCDVCNGIVKNFKSGLEKTLKSNFGGGNTNWEEKSLGKWKTSETRLVEIVEHHICEGNEKKCHMFFENYEESIENWYFNIYKDEDSADSLHNHLCVETAKVCCPPDTYGKDCQPCPTDNNEVCGGHGRCKGEGTRTGDGSCDCDTGYTSDLCDECDDGYYEQLTGTVKVCLSCDATCKDTCTASGPLGCDDCKTGYVWDDSTGCKDVDECEDGSHTCADKQSTYCKNTPGSFNCKSCYLGCLKCVDGKPSGCTECQLGYEKITSNDIDTFACLDIDECEDNKEICKEVIGSQCRNTIGSYQCQCPDNLERIDDQCVEKPPADAEDKQTETNSEDKNTKSTKDEL